VQSISATVRPIFASSPKAIIPTHKPMKANFSFPIFIFDLPF